MQLEHNAIKAVAKLAPWLAPVPSGWIVGRAALEHLALPLPVAVVTGLVVETLGLVSAYNLSCFSDWNRRRLKSDPAAPAIWPAILGGFYLVVVIGLVVILDVIPAAATWAPAALPLLALCGTVNLALIAGQEAREAEAAEAKAERKAERAEGRRRKAEAAEVRRSQAAEVERRRKSVPAPAAEVRSQAAVIMAEVPGITGAELGRRLGKSERWGRELRAELVGGNGNGRE